MAPRFTTSAIAPSRPLYRLVQQHAAGFIAHTGASTGSELPRFVKDEFDAFRERGILARVSDAALR